MTSIPEARIAEALAEHIHYGAGECRCGWGRDAEPSASIDEFFAHQAAVIAALPDIAVVDTSAAAAERDRKDARGELDAMRCVNGVAKYNAWCNVTYGESDEYPCEFGDGHYFDTPERVASLEARAAGGGS